MQLVFGVGRRSVVLATLKNMVLAFEMAFLPVLNKQSYHYFRFPVGHFEFRSRHCVLYVQQ
jgi:hypothetical protein